MLRTLKQLKNISGKRVLVRVDFNVPMNKGRVTDDTRIRETLPTLTFLLKKKAKIIIVTHAGRPEGKAVKDLRVDPIAKTLSKLIKKRVKKLNDSVGALVEKEISKMKNGEIIFLENIRFHKEEEKNDAIFSKKLAKLADIFVNDAFATCHRAHASTVGVAKLLPSYAGLLVEQEVKMLSPLLKKPAKPLVLVVGGAKVDTKIGLLKNFFGKADYILIGGALANTFLAAEGYDIGSSKYEPEKIIVAQELLLLAEKKKQKIILPQDVIVADSPAENATTLDLPLEDIEGQMKILDIGENTQAHFIQILKKAKTVIWNGPMGLYEFTPFSSGTKSIAHSLSKIKGKSYLGGGDTLDAIARLKISPKKFTFASTGGGAMLEFLQGDDVPGIKVLQ